MSLHETPSGERIHIGFFGLRNAGKSSLVNAVTAQSISLVSDVRGTTTDPVQKSMELLPLGPVVIIDTPGLDDEGELGAMRVARAKQMLERVHIAVLVVDAIQGLREDDQALLDVLNEKKLAHIVCLNKCDQLPQRMPVKDALYVSATTGEGVEELKERLAALGKDVQHERFIISDLLAPGAVALLVVPIDASAPKGRLILPQQQTIRDLLDHHMTALVCQDTEVKQTLAMLKNPPDVVITDSQVFGKVANDVPATVPLTSFSILMARYKGGLSQQIAGAAALGKLRDGDRVLIAEGCTHHRQCGDIGSVKIPNWLKNFSGAALQWDICSGHEFPEELSSYQLIIHCGGCMLNDQAIHARLMRAKAAGVPVVNYGVAIAHMHGILAKSLEIIPGALQQLNA